jgi:hypothetical protein
LYNLEHFKESVGNNLLQLSNLPNTWWNDWILEFMSRLNCLYCTPGDFFKIILYVSNVLIFNVPPPKKKGIRSGESTGHKGWLFILVSKNVTWVCLKNMYSPFSSLQFSKNSASICLMYPSEYSVQKEDGSIILGAQVMHHIPTLMSCTWHLMYISLGLSIDQYLLSVYMAA